MRFSKLRTQSENDPMKTSKSANQSGPTERQEQTLAFRHCLSVFVGVAIALSLVTACNTAPAPPPTEVEVEAATATTAGITEHVAADAILAPTEQAAIAAKISAPVRKFYVQRGSKVKAGQLLATLENKDLAATVQDNQGALQSAQATYQTTVQAQVPQDYQRAELDVAQAKANLDLNLEIVKSRTELFSQGAIAGRDLDTAKAALVEAQATYDAAQKRLASMQQVGRAAALKNAGGQLESAQGKYQGAEAELSYSEIRSPIAGVVTDRPLFAGETATAGTPLITVMNTAALLAKVHLPQAAAQLLKTGDTVSVMIPGVNPGPNRELDRDVKGKVTLISPALDPGSTTVEVWVQLDNRQGKLRPGSSVHVSMAGKSVPRALVVPSESIVTTSAGQKTVMAIDSAGVAHQTNVETGIEDGGMTQILSGISPGQRVVTAGAYALDDKTHVKVVASLGSDSDADAGKPDAAEAK